MREVFADTSGWASFFLRTETDHVAAVEVVRDMRAGGTRLVTTNYVVTEVVALFASRVRGPRTQWLAAVEALRSESGIDVVYIDRELDEEAWALLSSRLDKDWSLVDCASFALMRRRGISAALTSDHHFEQAGFAALLR